MIKNKYFIKKYYKKNSENKTKGREKEICDILMKQFPMTKAE